MEGSGAVRATSSPPGDLVGRHLGRYEVLAQIAAGGMAGVYVARAQGVAGFERLVAIKVLHPHLAYEDEFISMFLDEARLAARIRHPNVVATLDVSDDRGSGYFLVMDYIEGVNLAVLMRHAIEAKERLPEPVVLRVVSDGLYGLGAAHELADEHGDPLHLVHRDVSPHNVMVGVDGISRLTDFGVASASRRLTSTRQGTFKGKISYSSPEQALQRPVDGRADLFAMGIVFWECLTSRRLFRAEDESATLHKLLHEPIPSPSSVSPDLAVYDALLAKALEREPDRRFQTALEFTDAIEALGKPIARARDVGDTVRQRAAERLAEDAMRLQQVRAELGSFALEQTQPPAPRIYDPDVPTVAATDVTYLERKTGEDSGISAITGSVSRKVSALVRRRPLATVGVVLLMAVALVVVALVAIGRDGHEATPPRRATAASRPPAASPSRSVEEPPSRPPEPPRVVEQRPPPEPEPVPVERPGAKVQKRRPRASSVPDDASEDILVNPYRR